jgi:hypothetical protein
VKKKRKEKKRGENRGKKEIKIKNPPEGKRIERETTGGKKEVISCSPF